jgi:hypothetical protein
MGDELEKGIQKGFAVVGICGNSRVFALFELERK